MNFRALPLSILLLSVAASAEVVTFSQEDRFVGELLSMSAEEGLLMSSPNSPVPIAFKADSFDRLEMDGPHEADPFQTERLVLTNGDILPGNLRSLDEETVVYEGLVGGILNMDRAKISTLRFGIKPQALTYSGPAPLSDWSGNGSDSWVMSEAANEGLLLMERGRIQKNVALGQQFKIQFHLRWDENPSVRVYFGCDLDQEGLQDRYYIDINKAGVQVRRERSTEPRFQMLVSLAQNEAFDDKEVEVEVQVNRILGTLDLYLDGELVRQMEDSAPPTTGDSLIIERNGNDKSVSFLSNLRVYDWDAVSQIELLEETGDQDSDSLIDVEGKRISGTVLSLEEEAVDEANEEAPKPSRFLLQSPFADEPVAIPSKRTRIIYFQGSEQDDVATDFPKYEIDIANDGLVSAQEISLTEKNATLIHPLLGEVTLPRSAIKSIRFLNQLSDEEE